MIGVVRLLVDRECLLVERDRAGVVAEHVVHHPDINQGVAFAAPVTEGNTDVARTLELGETASEITHLHQCDAPLRAGHRFAALLPDRFVDADRGRTVLCRIGQR